MLKFFYRSLRMKKSESEDLTYGGVAKLTQMLVARATSRLVQRIGFMLSIATNIVLRAPFCCIH